VANTISGSGIDITFTTDVNWSGGEFNGEVFNFPTYDITNIAVTGTQIPGVTFDAHDIYINWESMNFSTSDNISIELDSSAVPEPSSFLLLATGLAGAVRMAARRLKA
jgi:hypothetical protein